MKQVHWDKVAFVCSIAIFAWLLGFATRAREWFPTDFLYLAWKQAKAVNPIGPLQYGFLHEPFYDWEGVRIPLRARMQPGLTVITSAWSHSGVLTPGLRLVDQDGVTVHEWSVDPAEVFGDAKTRRAVKDIDIQGSYLFPNGDVLVNLEYGGALRLDACGNVLWQLRASNHHSIARSDDGSFWIPAATPERLESPEHPNGFPGIDDPVYQDQLMHVAEDGTILDTINVLDVLYHNNLEWYLAAHNRLKDDDPTHVNDVEPLSDSLATQYPLFEAGDLVVSLRGIDLVFVLDPDSKRIKWKAAHSYIQQHDPDFIGDGWIGIFDNRKDGTDRGEMLGGSRVIAIQPHTDSMKILFPTPRSDPFYTAHRGKWQLLENGNMLLVEEGAGRVVEVLPDGRTVWEWVVEPASDSRIPAVTNAVRVALTRKDVAVWPCASGTGVDEENLR